MRSSKLRRYWLGVFLLAGAPCAFGQNLLTSRFDCGTLGGWTETDLARNPLDTLWHQECFCGIPLAGSGDYTLCSSPSTYASIVGAPGTITLWDGGAFALPFCATTCADPVNGPVIADDESSGPIPMPFPFSIFGAPVAAFDVNNNGLLTLGVGGVVPASVACSADGFTPDPIPSVGLPNGGLVAPFWADLVASATGSAVSYQVTGVPGSQVLTVEWNAMREWSTPCAVDVAEISVQARLFEGSDEIEFVYDVLDPSAPFALLSIGVEDTTGTVGVASATPGGFPPCNALRLTPIGISGAGGTFTYGLNPFPGGPIPIPLPGPVNNVCTPGTELFHTITVPDHGAVADLDVHLSLTHTWYGDLDITVTSPAGTVAFIKDGIPDDSSDLLGTYVLDDEAAGSWDAAATAVVGGVIAPGTYSVDLPLSVFDGEDAFGDWTITICDTFAGDVGSLDGAVLDFDLAPIPPVGLPAAFGLGAAAYNQGGNGAGPYTYATGAANEGALESPAIAPSAGADNLTMSFDMLRETEGGAVFDQSFVEARGTNDCNWKSLLQVTALAPCDMPTSITIADDAGLNGLLPAGGKVRFVFDTIDGVSNAYLGWYVDNVSVDEETFAGIDRYGAACACSGPCAPTISSIGGAATVGNGSFGMGLSNATGGAFAALFVGTPNLAGSPLGNGCDALLDLGMPFFHSVRVPSLPGTMPGQGCTSVPLPIPCDPALTGAQFGFQWAVADPAAAGGFCVTDALDITVQTAAISILVEAEGTNSFNADPTEGFFKVHANGVPGCSPAIQTLRFSWFGSSNPAQATMTFDTDQTGMADVPWGGNSLVVGCHGTYRNGSDLSTGLVYGPPNSVPGCDPTAFSGFDPSDVTSAAGNAFKTLEWDFTPGMFLNQTFELDCDTDGGAGITGGAMAGMVVTITLTNGVVLMGELTADPGNANRSFLQF